MTEAHAQTLNPEAGMLAIVRKRRGIISEVREFDGEEGRHHLVRIEYKDDARPSSEDLLWELEPAKRLLEPSAMPQASDPVMPEDDFDALVRAARWTAITPYLDPDVQGPLDRLPVCSPFHGSIEVEDYQLVPLLKALRMPRVNLLIADDVGLGKTIEAGLILSELLIRRRINRVLILTPASLRIQWRDELWAKFALPFDVIDRDHTLNLKRTLGVDANPWRCSSRAIASYHYLRQPDVIEQFISACRTPEGSPHLPWDLLIVDEVHNLMPSPFGEDSQLCRTLRLIAPQFEHRLFLTATPHNGHTRAFSGLLELLDPVRFSRTDELRPAERERIKQVVIRRLKREVNERTNPPRFCTRKQPEALLLKFSKEEQDLINAFESFRKKVRELIAASSRKRRLAGSFAIEILGKRMLSGPVTFLESWRRCKMGLQTEEAADDEDMRAAGQAANEETDDDREAEQRGATAAAVIGAWMQPLAKELESEIAKIDAAAGRIGIVLNREVIPQNPVGDARFDILRDFIEQRLRHERSWRDDERLVLFTEYKTTLDYLLRRLREAYPDQQDRFLCLYGGMGDVDREAIKDAFNDPQNKVRVLIATDAASEGLNLQSTARYVLHFDCPWNPARLEQRNGRLDRHGQARDVHVFHFASEQEADLKFLAYLIYKVHQIREDLGATGELFDEATHRCLVLGENPAAVQKTLDEQIVQVTGTTRMDADNTVAEDAAQGEAAIVEKLKALAGELDLDPVSGHATLEAAMAADAGRPQLTAPDEQQRFSLVNPNLLGWKDTIDETIRKRTGQGLLGPVPKLTFSVKPFMVPVGERTVFRPRVDTLMLHLAHPLIQRATGRLTRHRFPGPNAVSRWTVKLGDVPAGVDALVLLHIEELAVNQLRETFHHWVRTIVLPVVKGELRKPYGHTPAIALRDAQPCRDPNMQSRAASLLSDLEPDLQAFVKTQRRDLTEQLLKQLKQDQGKAHQEEERNFQSRQGEISSLIADNTLAKLERQIARFKEMKEGQLFEDKAYFEELDHRIEMKQDELMRRKQHYEEVQEQLTRERERIVKRLLPRRYTLQGEAQVFPVAVEIRFPQIEGGVR